MFNRKKEPPGSVEERQKELKGFVLGVFRIGDLVNETLSSLSLRGIDLYLFDASESVPAKRFLYSHASGKTTTSRVSGDF
jgi:hypothetical protein